MNLSKFLYFFIFLIIVLPISSQSLETIDVVKKELESTIEGIEGSFGQDQDPALQSEDFNEEIAEPEYYKDFFGYDFFLNSTTPEESFTDIPMDGEYKLSFGDEVTLVINGPQDNIYELNIDLAGSILIPTIGTVKIVGLSISEANKKVDNIVRSKQIGSESSLGLSKASLRKISIVGEVTKPGSYLINPFSLLTEVISYAGFLKEYASIRTVTIIKNTGERATVDLYDFLINGEIDSNLTISNGDTILINSSNKFVSIEGAVKQSKKFEYIENDSYSKIIAFAKLESFADLTKATSNLYRDNLLITEKIKLNDVLKDAQLDSIYVPTRLKFNSTSAQVVGNAVSDGFYKYTKGDPLSKIMDEISFSENIYPFAFFLEQYKDRGFTKIKKTFSVLSPDEYSNFTLGSNVKITFLSREEISEFSNLLSEDRLAELSEDPITELSDILSEEQIAELSEEQVAQLSMALIGNETKELFNETDDFESSSLDSIYVTFGDKEYVLSRDQASRISNEKYNFEFNYLNSLYVTYGEKVFVLPMAGIFSVSAIMNYLGIQDQVDLDKTFLNTGERKIKYTQASQGNSFKFLPGMHLSFSPKFYGSYIDIELNGEINFPGKYRVKKGITYLNAVELAGGYSNNIDLRGIFLSRSELREKERISFSNARDLLLDALIQGSNNGSSNNQVNSSSNIQLLEYLEEVAIDSFSGRLVADFTDNSRFKEDLILQDGDNIIFAQKVKYIITQGQLNNPSTVPFSHSYTINDYINASGGFTKYADKNNVYVIKYNGESVVTSNNPFQQDYVIQPGDIIVVPRNVEFISTIPLVSQMVQILSDIAFAAASLNAIQR